VVTGFKQVDTKNQDNLKINETNNNNDSQNTPKNEGLSPQKPVTIVTLVTKRPKASSLQGEEDVRD